jgi:outer membrane protein assembly factor BamE (lipoprotein component of BamABCDE complex)
MALVLAALLVGQGCSLFRSPVIARGNRPSEEQIKDISVGVHSRADVQAMLGSPTSSSAFGDQSWYYISAQTRVRPMRHLGISDPETVAIDFDERGTVKQVRVLREADMVAVRMVSRETPSPGNERTLMQALFGNVGRIGPQPTTTGDAPGVQAAR